MLIQFLDGTSRDVANLSGAYLHSADLSGADLSGADLRGADLSAADLHSADLRGANLSGAYLHSADLHSADLHSADLRGANLRGADLSDADLRGANLSNANLSAAYLHSADLSGADLSGAKGLSQFVIVPAGEILGYKKLAGGTIATLRIPADAKRVNAYGSRKCRAEFAYVIEGTGKAVHDGMPYAPGLILPDKFDPDPRVECSNGIHFFITREEAEAY